MPGIDDAWVVGRRRMVKEELWKERMAFPFLSVGTRRDRPKARIVASKGYGYDGDEDREEHGLSRRKGTRTRSGRAAI